jgi:hypothetical protein
LLLLSSAHISTEAMGDPAVVPDCAYLEAVTQKRIRIFEEIQARQALERLNIGGESIKWVFSLIARMFCFITSAVNLKGFGNCVAAWRETFDRKISCNIFPISFSSSSSRQLIVC